MGTFPFIPALQAYLSSRLPYNQRARGLGIMEYARALAGILGLLRPWLYRADQLARAVFIIAGVLLVMSFVFRALPSAREGHDGLGAAAATQTTTAHAGRLCAARRESSFGLGCCTRLGVGWIMFAPLVCSPNYGTWLPEWVRLDAPRRDKSPLYLAWLIYVPAYSSV
ncbi:MAG: hypothetical protein IPL78_09725 [Chloroflexi bacterium]|nr:hypothetical protein [Chloroflexota bacterium]